MIIILNQPLKCPSSPLPPSRSEGLAGTYHGSLLGVYTWDEDDHGRNVTRHQRRVFRHVATAGRHWLYYWDWGPNSGANWMVGSQLHFYS